MSYIDPTNYETLYYVADFLSGGWQTFIVPAAWTFSAWFDGTIDSLIKGISGSE